ncbi:unnamed protein product, partial [Polarella glacialis]
ASEALQLLHRAGTAFAEARPEPAAAGEVVVSVDPNEDLFHGHGLPAFMSHVWADGQVPGFTVRHGLPCSDVLVVRDSLPSMPFPGALVYVDHEAGLGPGRDAGRLDVVLSRYRVVYLGVLEPLAETRCSSRWGSSPAARDRRVCAKVFSGVASLPGGGRLPVVLHVPFASTSFAARLAHSPMDL